MSNLGPDLVEIPEIKPLFPVMSSNDKSKVSEDDKDNIQNVINLMPEAIYLTIESIDSKFQSIFNSEKINVQFFELNMKELAKELRQYMHDHNFAQFFIDENINGKLNATGQQQREKVEEIIIRNPIDFLTKLTKEEEMEFLRFLQTKQFFRTNGYDNNTEKNKIMFYTSLQSELEHNKIKLTDNTQISVSSSTNYNPSPHSKNSTEAKSSSTSFTYIPERERLNLINIQNSLKELYKKRAQKTFGDNLYLEIYKVLLINY